MRRESNIPILTPSRAARARRLLRAQRRRRRRRLDRRRRGRGGRHRHCPTRLYQSHPSSERECECGWRGGEREGKRWEGVLLDVWMLVLVLVLTVVPHLILLILLLLLNVLERMRHELRRWIGHRLHLNLRLLIAYTPPRTRSDKRMHLRISTFEGEGDVAPIQPRFPTRTKRDARIAELEDVRLYSFSFSA